MDRKTTTIVTEIKNTVREIEGLKTSQMSGDDNNRLYRLSTGSSYDLSLTIPSGARGQIYIDASYFGFILPWQPTAFMSVNPQFFVGSPSTPYLGQFNSGLAMINPYITVDIYSAASRHQMVNITGSALTVYVKMYFISTVANANASWSAEII